MIYGNEETNGGVLIFLTDGQESSCDNDIDGDITNPELLQRIEDRRVRIVTIAFGYYK